MSHRPEFVYGYHGCDESVAKRILEGSDPLSPSYNAYDWLGSGIYFWEDAPERAMQWAVEMKKPHPAVVGAVIELGNCLNLDSSFENAKFARCADNRGMESHSGDSPYG